MARPERLRTLEQIAGSGSSVIARGLGRAYGDAAVSSRGTTILMQRLNRMLAFDEQTGALTCEGGVSLDDILHTFGPRGFLPPVLPGTRFVTVGGAIACDIHGKNHHRDGSLSRHVTSMRVLLANGELTECNRQQNADLFWATAGGMGLTGIIVDATITLRRSSGALTMDQKRAPDLDATLRLFEQDEQYEYSVAWIDCLAKGRHLGRSVLMRANSKDSTTCPPAHLPTRLPAHLPTRLPNLLQPSFVKAFNAAYYATHRDKQNVHPLMQTYFFPLDGIPEWNRLYGSRGFVQYQFVVPPTQVDTVRIALERITQARTGSFLAVLKRFGPGEAGQLLSFPMEGYTLAVDFPVSDDVFGLLNGLDELIAGAGGRVYLAKDARLRPDAFRAMYAQLAKWQAIKSELDPANRFSSDLSKRLGVAAA